MESINVVRLSKNGVFADYAAKCVGLEPTVCSEIAHIVTRHHNGREKWLWHLKQTRGISGLVIIYPPRQDPLTLPPPAEVAFEPTLLSEAEPNIAAIASVGAPGKTRPPADETRSRPLRRIGVKLGILLSVVVASSFFLLDLLQFGRMGAAILAGITGVAVLITMLRWVLEPDWFVIPGGVVIRRSGWDPGDNPPIRCARDESILIFQPHNVGWEATIWTPKRAYTTNLTTLEAVALLAAWQSPLRTPTIEELSDLK